MYGFFFPSPHSKSSADSHLSLEVDTNLPTAPPSIVALLIGTAPLIPVFITKRLTGTKRPPPPIPEYYYTNRSQSHIFLKKNTSCVFCLLSRFAIHTMRCMGFWMEKDTLTSNIVAQKLKHSPIECCIIE